MNWYIIEHEFEPNYLLHTKYASNYRPNDRKIREKQVVSEAAEFFLVFFFSFFLSFRFVFFSTATLFGLDILFLHFACNKIWIIFFYCSHKNKV